jgi:hypothetical protein
LLCFLARTSFLCAQEQPSEYQVKAAYLYNFGKFVQWPAQTSTGNTFAICVLGNDPFGPILDATVANQTINGKQLVVKRISRALEASSCRVVFVSDAESGRLEKIFPILDKFGVLTVSDMPHFVQRGGMIQLVLEGDKVRFEANPAAAQKAGLALSSELLKVATKVTGSTEGRQ